MQTIALGMPGAARNILEAPLLGIWIEAIAQHYGSGSRFLDVSTDIDTALWFALHSAENKTTWENATSAIPILEHYKIAGLDTVTEVLISRRTTHYTPMRDKTGWLHVLHVPVWSRRGEPGHGSLIDLAAAPPLLEFECSKRMNHQHACLVAADGRVKNGDLSDFYACPPIAVRWPLAGNEGVNRPAGDLFPSPDDDAWYALFLSIPFHAVPGPPRLVEDASRGEGWVRHVNLRWTRPLPVTVYWTQDSKKSSMHAAVPQDDNLLDPNFVYPLMCEEPSAEIERATSWIDENSTAEQLYRLDQAAVVMLESPLVATLPPLELWNHSVLHGDLAPVTESFFARELPEQPFSREEGKPKPLTKEQEEEYTKLLATPFKLTNVFLELSPLEEIRWNKIGNTNAEVLRAMWLTHNLGRFVLFLYHQSLPGRGPARGLTVQGPLLYEYHKDRGRFGQMIAGKEGARWIEVSGEQNADRPFFGMLSLLRALSPGPGLELKADPFPSEIIPNGSRHIFKIAIRSRAAHLAHGSYIAGGRQILTVQGSTMSTFEGSHSNEVYDLNSAPIHSYLEAESEGPWQDLGGEPIRRWIEENLSYKV